MTRQKNPIRLLLSRPISFHPLLADICEGSITAALYLSQAIYYTEVTEAGDGWFWKKSQEWEKETRLSRRQQDTAREILRKLGFLKEALRNSPPVMHFRVDFDMLESAILNLAESAKLDGGNAQINLAESAKSYKEAKTTYKDYTENTDTLFSQEDNPLELIHSSSNKRKEKTSDPRHAILRNEILVCFSMAPGNCGVVPAWAGREAGVLSRLLKSSELTAGMLVTCIKNRFASQENFSEPPYMWIAKLPKYLGGPLDKYGKPLEESHGKSRQQQRRENNRRNIVAGAQAYLGNSKEPGLTGRPLLSGDNTSDD